MRKTYHDKFQMECCFLEDGITFCNSKRDVFFPYGSMDTLSLSFLGVMQAVSHALVCCFTVNKADKAEIKELVKKAKESNQAADRKEPVVIDYDKVPAANDSSADGQLKHFKGLYVQGMITKEQFDFKKRLLADK